MKDSFQLYRRLLGSARPYLKVVVLSILAMIAAASLEPVLPALLKPLVDESLIKKSHTAQWQVPLFLMLAFLAKGVAEYVASVSSQWIANKAITDLRQQVFRHQMHLPIPVHQAETGGRMLSRILYDIPQVGAALSNAWIIVIRDTMVIIGLTGYLVYTAWELTLVILAIAPIVAWLIRVASRKLRGSNREMQETTGRMTGMVEETLNGVREIKLFGTHDHEDARFASVSEQLRQQTMRTVRVSAINVPLVQVLAAAAVATVIWTAGSLSAQDKLSPGEFVSFVTAMSMLFEPIRRLTNINAVIQRGLAGAQSIFELLDTPPEVDSASASLPRAKGELRFDDVSFRYPGQAELALQHFSLDVHPGQTVALVGASGSGKSTLVNLIARFFEPGAGRILLDGTPLASLPLAHLRAQLGWVGQQVVLFDDSIAANIAYGRPDVSEADIVAAARAAHAMECIDKLPQGLATRVGANGSQLSGGQRQRIAIARALALEPKVVIADEPVSALDVSIQAQILNLLSRLVREMNLTMIFIAHDLSVVKHISDRIAVMYQGKIVELGAALDVMERPQHPYTKTLISAIPRIKS